jgi:hypothetical protein
MEDLLPAILQEGDTLELPFDDNSALADLKRLRPVGHDSLGRYWPRHRRLLLFLRRWSNPSTLVPRRIRHGAVPTQQEIEHVQLKIIERNERVA